MHKKPTHILVIPSWYNTDLTPQQGMIFEEHTEMLYRAGYKVGVLYPCFYKGFISRLFRGAKNIVRIQTEHHIPVFIIACASIVPYIRYINYRYLFNKADKLFQSYVKMYGWPDAFQSHVSLAGGVIASFLSRKYRIPYIHTEHASALLISKINWEDKCFVKRVFKNARNVIVVSNFFKEELVKRYSLDSSNIKVIHNNFNPIFSFLSGPKAITKPFVFINVGGLVPVKDHKLLIDSFEIAARKNPDIILRIVGDGPLRLDLGNYVTEKKLNDRIFFTGKLSRENVKEEIYKTHALVSTSRMETFGINIIESLACGRPVIATDSGGPRDIVTDKDGYLVKDHDPIAIANAMADMLKYYDKFNSAEIASRCTQRFSEGIISKKLDVVFKREYQVCARCILDTIDYPNIEFDENGVCSICHINDSYLAKTILSGEKGRIKLQKTLQHINKIKRRHGYNCILGISGGIDSTFLALQVKKWGLKPLVVHVDNGWNSETAIGNIEQMLKKLNLDLETYVVDWDSMKDMHYAFLRSSVIDIELPYDNKFLAMLYEIARKHKLKHILCGYNSVSEGILPPNFTHYKFDTINIKKIHRSFGRMGKVKFKLLGPVKYLIYEKILGIRIISPLNYVDYNKKEAKKILINELNWKDYGYKHYENVFTRFYQGYILPNKFIVDKRKGHLSALICSGQIDRTEAENEIRKNIYGSELLLENDKNFVLKKLEISENEFKEIMKAPVHRHTEYSSYLNIFKKIPKFIRKFLRLIIDETT
jgi:N-acetyl sugar amidotransferase